MATSRDHSTAVGPARDLPWGRLVRGAFTALLDRAARPAAPPLRVVLAADRDLSGLLADLHAAGAEPHVAAWAGRTLGRMLARDDLRRPLRLGAVRPRVLIVDRIDRIGDLRRQAAAAAFLDVLEEQGVSTCLTVGRGDAERELAGSLQSRLAAGLVIQVPSRPPGHGRSDASARSLNRLVRITARRQGLSVATVTGPNRSRAVVEVRNLAMYLARRLTGGSFHAIGAAVGGRDHSTVIRGIRTIEERIASDATFAHDVARLLAWADGSRNPIRKAGRTAG